MTRKKLILLATLLCLTTALPAAGQGHAKRQLTSLFLQAEQCYLMDDYRQLQQCIGQYNDVLSTQNAELGDSADVFQAYRDKMLGAYYYGLSENDSCARLAEQMYTRSLAVFDQRGNTTNATVLHEELAQLYYKRKSYALALTQLETVFNHYDEQLNDMGIATAAPKYYQVMTQLAMCHARLGHFGLALQQMDEAIGRHFRRTKNADYYEALRKRAKILMMQALCGSTFHVEHPSPLAEEAVKGYRQYVDERCAAISRELGSMSAPQRQQHWLAMHRFLYDCYRLGNLAPEMLYDLALYSKDFLVRQETSATTWKQVRRALNRQQDCALEFVQYFGRDDERRMGCLVLRPDSKKPVFIDLFSVDSLLALPLNSLYTVGEAVTSTLSAAKDALYQDAQLPRLVWPAHLLAAIGDAENVYFAPDGLLHQLAIEYLMPAAGKTCHRLSSTRILTQQRSTPRLQSALLMGGISYGSAATYLPGSKTEVDSILACRQHPQDRLISGQQATQEAFLQSVEQEHFDVVHLSTHGYFSGHIGIDNDIKPLLADEPMTHSGLLFATGNRLTAASLSTLDLSQTELIVLSACQTGVGHITDDGIYGIQRGLKQAGAQAMIVSLWSVSDRSCCLLMQFFYQELEQQQGRKDVQAAFLKARQRLMAAELVSYQLDGATLTLRQKNIRFSQPQHTNPFVLIDAY